MLLVEDDTITRRTPQRMLAERFGCRVDTLSTGAGVVEAVQTRRYDLLFLDCLLPGLSGFEITQAIRSLEGEAATTYIPFLLLLWSSDGHLEFLRCVCGAAL